MDLSPPAAGMLQLRELEPVARGLSRMIYRYPAAPQLLVKVLRPERAQWYRQQRFGWYQKRRRYRGYSGSLQELREMIAVYAHEGALSPHLQRIVGLVDTDCGLGLVVQALYDAQGAYAPPLAQVVRQGRFDEPARQALERFFDWLLASPIVVTDLNWGNLLYATDAAGGTRFVLVDGFGESAAVPLRSLFDAFNRRSKRRRIRALRDKIESELALVSRTSP